MNQQPISTVKDILESVIKSLRHAFDVITDWVTQISWVKFCVFAVVVLIIGAITEDMVSAPEEQVIVGGHAHAHKGKVAPDHDTDIEINKSGIHIRKNKNPAPAPALPEAPDAPDASGTNDSTDASDAATEAASTAAAAAAAADKAKKQSPSDDEIHVQLPPGVSDDISNAINEEIASANESDKITYRKEKSTWLMSLVMISLIGLFGIKALMGGKRRAELKAQEAQEDAERESLHRQVAEARMQMMQAQIEPHFLFNTLASVEHLIEIDPPRASAMQRSLIQYLRAVIPQVRENASNTNLGREASIVKEYLTLLKMRMEERLEFTVSIPEGLNTAAFPTMMLQTLVENSIKHGLEPKTEGGTINITAEVAHNKLRVSVIDNGLGFGMVPSTGTGVGLQNIRERLALLYQGNHQFIITPNQPSGVTVTIEIPYQYTS